MFEKFERRGWLYWIVLLLMTWEFVRLSFLLMLQISFGESSNSGNNSFESIYFNQFYVIYTILAHILSTIFLFFYIGKFQISYRIAIFYSILFLFWMIIEFQHVSTAEVPETASRFFVRNFGSFLCLAFIVWALRRICRPRKGTDRNPEETSA